MDKKIHIGTSPLTGTIYAGHLLKCGKVWAANKQDVTTEALAAVVDYLIHKGKEGVYVALEDDKLRYSLMLSINEMDKPKENG